MSTSGGASSTGPTSRYPQPRKDGSGSQRTSKGTIDPTKDKKAYFAANVIDPTDQEDFDMNQYYYHRPDKERHSNYGPTPSSGTNAPSLQQQQQILLQQQQHLASATHVGASHSPSPPLVPNNGSSGVAEGFPSVGSQGWMALLHQRQQQQQQQQLLERQKQTQQQQNFLPGSNNNSARGGLNSAFLGSNQDGFLRNNANIPTRYPQGPVSVQPQAPSLLGSLPPMPPSNFNNLPLPQQQHLQLQQQQLQLQQHQQQQQQLQQQQQQQQQQLQQQQQQQQQLLHQIQAGAGTLRHPNHAPGLMLNGDMSNAQSNATGSDNSAPQALGASGISDLRSLSSSRLMNSGSLPLATQQPVINVSTGNPPSSNDPLSNFLSSSTATGGGTTGGARPISPRLSGLAAGTTSYNPSAEILAMISASAPSIASTPTALEASLSSLSLSQDHDFASFPGTQTSPDSGASIYQALASQALLNASQTPSDKAKQYMMSMDPYGMFGLLRVLKMTDKDLTTLALGTDLTTLGLNLSSPDVLYSTFSGPWATTPLKHEPEYQIPVCYFINPPLPPPTDKMTLFSEETLFYIFYCMPRDALQVAAATELFDREWRFQTELQVWFHRVPGTEPSVKTPTYELGSFFYFDVASWEKLRKDNYVLEYDKLEASQKSQQH